MAGKLKTKVTVFSMEEMKAADQQGSQIPMNC